MKINEQEFDYYFNKIILFYQQNLINASLSGNENKLYSIFEEMFSDGDKNETIKGLLKYLSKGDTQILEKLHNARIEHHFRNRLARCLDDREPEVVKLVLKDLFYELEDFIKNY
ncbi:hypothetical protein AB3329_01730 [Streptococcus sp. H31]|uniref:hypothetical protein n=1 Tax=Streptococcus huangxiaojuni TaxID=3237239 RepID=UPI0034A0D1D6